MSLKNANKVDTNRVELEIEVDADRFESAVNDAYKKNVRRMNTVSYTHLDVYKRQRLERGDRPWNMDRIYSGFQGI